ncbi:MAG: alpha/beta hydrolase [Candidatus Micrarchaeota archaeon]|nr:alpha/beta hydrolase [Candidatus Micrarchaeota archaeon]
MRDDRESWVFGIEASAVLDRRRMQIPKRLEPFMHLPSLFRKDAAVAETERYETINGRGVHYYDIGGQHSKVMLLIHGAASTAERSWSPHMQHFERAGFRVIAPDLPGFGRSERMAKRHSMETYSEFIDGFIKHLGIKSMVLMGSSLGGGVAVRYSLENPGNVSRLILVDSYGFYSNPLGRAAHLGLQLFSPKGMKLVVEQLYRVPPRFVSMAINIGIKDRKITKEEAHSVSIFFHEDKVNESTFEFVKDDISHPGTIRMHGKDITVPSLKPVDKVKSDYRDRIAELNRSGIRILVIHGIDDRLIPHEKAREAYALLENATIAPMPGGHMAHKDNPHIFNQIVVEFLLEGEARGHDMLHKVMHGLRRTA